MSWEIGALVTSLCVLLALEGYAWLRLRQLWQERLRRTETHRHQPFATAIDIHELCILCGAEGFAAPRQPREESSNGAIDYGS